MGALIRQSETGTPSENQVNITDKISIEKIVINPFQPRNYFDQESLEELASSIKNLGIIQPITVRETENDQYQIISGERRYRASLIAGLTEIPAYIRHAEDNNMLELALVENVQREDLDAIEIAISYQRLIDECEITQEDLSERIGKKRSTIANYMRLLRLPAEIQLAIRQKQISMGHARALVNIPDKEQKLRMLQTIIETGLSVRQVEIEVHKINSPEIVQNQEPEAETTNNETRENIDIVVEEGDDDEDDDNESLVVYEDTHPTLNTDVEQNLKELLSRRFGTKVKVKITAKGTGSLVIPFKTDAELQQLIKLTEKIESL